MVLQLQFDFVGYMKATHRKNGQDKHFVTQQAENVTI